MVDGSPLFRLTRSQRRRRKRLTVAVGSRLNDRSRSASRTYQPSFELSIGVVLDRLHRQAKVAGSIL